MAFVFWWKRFVHVVINHAATTTTIKLGKVSSLYIPVRSKTSPYTIVLVAELSLIRSVANSIHESRTTIEECATRAGS